VLADHELRRYLRVGQTPRDEPQHLELARRQLGELGRRLLRRAGGGGSLFSPTITRRLIEQFAAITGGTGAYVGAAWTMTRKGNGKRDTLTFTLE
jgi:hypothetical protein